MAESPPKRVTRAQAKASEDLGPNVRATKVTTASARIAAQSKTLAKAAKQNKRRPRAIDPTLKSASILAEAQDTNSDKRVKTGAAEESRSCSKPKQATEEANANVVVAEVLPRTRSRLGNAEAVIKSRKGPGNIKNLRSKKSKETTAANTVEGAGTECVIQETVKKPTRTRATTKVQVPTKSALKVSVPKKRVTFQDRSHEDKENVGGPSENAETAQSKPAKLSAKPVRKASSARTSGQRKNAISHNTQDEIVAGMEEVARPLSPKKVTQVAKSSSISSEDELCGNKSLPKTLTRSPIRAPMSTGKSKDSPQEGPMIDTISPAKSLASAILGSPARRPPPSPFKNSLKDSPRRVDFDRAANTITVPALVPSQTPYRTSLLHSPVRRPMSPLKQDASVSTIRTGKGIRKHDATHDMSTSNMLNSMAFTPSKLRSSPLRRAQPIEGLVKVHQMTPAEKEAKSHRVEISTEDRIDEQQFDHTEFPIHPISTSKLSPSMRSKRSSLLTDYGSGPEQQAIYITSRNEDLARSPTNPTDTPLREPIFETGGPFGLTPAAFRQTTEDSDSEDELQSAQDLVLRAIPGQAAISPEPFGQAHFLKQEHSIGQSNRNNRVPTTVSNLSLTPLALQLSSWLASSPEKEKPRCDQNKTHRILFTPKVNLASKTTRDEQQFQTSSHLKSTLFDDEMLVRAQEIVSPLVDQGTMNMNTVVFQQASQLSDESEEFGDENAVPVNPQQLDSQHAFKPTFDTCTPAKVFQLHPREIHTVSKVPLRPAGEESPLKVVHKRSRSLSSRSTIVRARSGPTMVRSNTASYSCSRDDTTEWRSNNPSPGEYLPNSSPMQEGQSAFSNDAWSTFGTPTRTLRIGANAEIMRGAVVFVDVHTTEGADASGIFIELLTQMGAKCVKQWTWNPRASSSSTTELAAPCLPGSPSETTPSRKVRITHVVYKDGGKRTLGKVRESNGRVLCVGVGWVLE